MKGLRKNVKNLWVASTLAKMVTWCPLIASLKCYCLKQPTWYVHGVVIL